MRYFSLFSGVGGFELGIEKAYADKKVDVATTHPSALSRGQEAINGAGVDIELPDQPRSNGSKNIISPACADLPQPEVQDERPDGGLLSGDRSHALQRDDLRDPTCIGFSEIDKHASAVLKYRFPNVKNYGDITKIDWAGVPDFDLLVGGSPCQSFSIAGKRAGLEGSSGLFVEYVRCLKEKKPEYFIWENVKGVFSSGKGADFAYVLDSFSEAGYSVTWQLLNAKHFGVPQNRERVFVIGHLGTEPPRKVFFVPTDDGVRPSASSDEEKVHDIAQAQTARQYASWGGNYAVEEITHGTDQAHRVYSPDGVHRTLAANGEGLGAKMGLVSVQRCGDRDKNTVSTMEVAHTLPANPMSDYLPKITDFHRVRRLTPKECERLMSWPDDWTRYADYGNGVKEVSDTQRYKMCGNGVVSNVIAELVKAHFLPLPLNK